MAREKSSLVAQWWRIHQLMQKIQVWSLSQEDPMEKEMATHSIILAWEIPWMEKSGALQSTGSQRVKYDWATEQQHRWGLLWLLTVRKLVNILCLNVYVMYRWWSFSMYSAIQLTHTTCWHCKMPFLFGYILL